MSECIQKAFVEDVSKRLAETDISHNQFGKDIFGEASGGRIWRGLREGARTRKLSLEEACRMAERLGLEFPNLLWSVAQGLNNRV